MKLQLKSFADVGNLEKERLVIAVTADDELGQYAVFVSGLTADQNVTSGRKTAYWFPDQPLSAGDRVVLYTKEGTTSKKEMESGGTARFFYWGLKASLWTGERGAVLLRVAEWTKLLSQKA